MSTEASRRCAVCGALSDQSEAALRLTELPATQLPAALLAYDPASLNPIYHFLSGIRFYFVGLRFLLSQRRLKRLTVIPIILTIIIFMLLLVGGYFLADYFWASAADGWWGRLLVNLGRLAVILILLVVAYFLFFPVATLVLAPFNEQLAVRVEQLALPTHQCSMTARRLDWLRSLLDNVRLLTFQGLILLLLLPLNLIPGVGSIPMLLALIFFAGLDYLDVPASVKRYRLRDKLRLLLRHKALMFGFGCAAYGLLLVPGINLLSIPVGVTGATLLFLRLDKD